MINISSYTASSTSFSNKTKKRWKFSWHFLCFCSMLSFPSSAQFPHPRSRKFRFMFKNLFSNIHFFQLCSSSFVEGKREGQRGRRSEEKKILRHHKNLQAKAKWMKLKCMRKVLIHLLRESFLIPFVVFKLLCCSCSRWIASVKNKLKRCRVCDSYENLSRAVSWYVCGGGSGGKGWWVWETK